MSTRSHICRKNEDGTYDIRYCHSDGYISWNGRALFDHFNTDEKVNTIFEGKKDISSIERDSGRIDFYEDFEWSYEKVNYRPYCTLHIEYVYIWENGKWTVSCNKFVDKKLTSALIKRKSN
jgi:hypothetical protein